MQKQCDNCKQYKMMSKKGETFALFLSGLITGIIFIPMGIFLSVLSPYLGMILLGAGGLGIVIGILSFFAAFVIKGHRCKNCGYVTEG